MLAISYNHQQIGTFEDNEDDHKQMIRELEDLATIPKQLNESKVRVLSDLRPRTLIIRKKAANLIVCIQYRAAEPSTTPQ